MTKSQSQWSKHKITKHKLNHNHSLFDVQILSGYFHTEETGDGLLRCAEFKTKLIWIYSIRQLERVGQGERASCTRAPRWASLHIFIVLCFVIFEVRHYAVQDAATLQSINDSPGTRPSIHSERAH